MKEHERLDVLGVLEQNLEDSIETSYKLYKAIKTVRETESRDVVYDTIQEMAKYISNLRLKYMENENVLHFPKR